MDPAEKKQKNPWYFLQEVGWNKHTERTKAICQLTIEPILFYMRSFE